MHAKDIELGCYYALAPMTGSVVVQAKKKSGQNDYKRPLFRCVVIECPKDCGLEEGQELELTADRLSQRS